MANKLAMYKNQGFEQLFSSVISERQTARTLEIDRKSVSSHLRKCGAQGAQCSQSAHRLDQPGAHGLNDIEKIRDCLARVGEQ